MQLTTRWFKKTSKVAAIFLTLEIASLKNCPKSGTTISNYPIVTQNSTMADPPSRNQSVRLKKLERAKLSKSPM